MENQAGTSAGKDNHLPAHLRVFAPARSLRGEGGTAVTQEGALWLHAAHRGGGVRGGGSSAVPPPAPLPPSWSQALIIITGGG